MSELTQSELKAIAEFACAKGSYIGPVWPQLIERMRQEGFKWFAGRTDAAGNYWTRFEHLDGTPYKGVFSDSVPGKNGSPSLSESTERAVLAYLETKK